MIGLEIGNRIGNCVINWFLFKVYIKYNWIGKNIV